jgi:hypothetical protein
VGVTADAVGKRGGGLSGSYFLIFQTVKQVYAEFDADFESLLKNCKKFLHIVIHKKENEFSSWAKVKVTFFDFFNEF